VAEPAAAADAQVRAAEPQAVRRRLSHTSLEVWIGFAVFLLVAGAWHFLGNSLGQWLGRTIRGIRSRRALRSRVERSPRPTPGSLPTGRCSWRAPCSPWTAGSSLER